MGGWLDFCCHPRDDVAVEPSSSGDEPANSTSGWGIVRGILVGVVVLVGLAVVVAVIALSRMPCGTLGGSCGPGMSPEARAEQSAEFERRRDVAREICVPTPDSIADEILDGITWNTVGDWGHSINEVYLSAVRIESPEGSYVVSVRFPISGGGGQRTFALLVTGPLESPDSVAFLPSPWPSPLNKNPTTFDETQDDTISYYYRDYLDRESDYVEGCRGAGLETGPYQKP